MITLSREGLANSLPEADTLNLCVRQFENTLPRLHRLNRYYEGRHDILSRTRLSGLPNNRVTHAFPRYIAQVSASYLLGEPARVEGPEPQTQALRELMLHAATDAIDVELALHQAVFGRAVSLCYEDASLRPHVCALDPRSAFVVYDDTVAQDPLFGVYVSGAGQDRQLLVYTKSQAARFSAQGRLLEVKPHPFRALPMTEYLNGTDAHGDFEDVLALIDAYDLLQADRLNDRQQFSDALLVLTGVMGIGAGEGDNPLERLRQEKTLALPDEHARAEWLVKTPMEKDIDILREALSQDIHKFSLTPDFTDERFAGNASGVAIQYKLFNFDNRVKLKERWFITGLRERARAFCGWLDTRRHLHLDADELAFRLTRRLPVNEPERAQTISALKDILPYSTLLFNSPLTEDPQRRREGSDA